MKALTEMKRKNPALVFRYSFPQKLNFSVNATASKNSPSFPTISSTHHPTLSTPSSLGPPSKTESSCSFLNSSASMTALSSTNSTRQSVSPCEVQNGTKTAQTFKKFSKAKRKKNVSFQDGDEIWGIVSRKDISAEERQEMWYSREEYEKIIQACSKQISMLDRGKLLKDRKFCARGLESNTRLQAGTKSMNRCLAYQAVLGEQERQIRAGFVVLDDSEIAHLYNASSYSCQLWAHAVGLADQRVAQDIQDESAEDFYPEEQSCTSAGSDLQELEIPDQLVARAA